MSETSTMRRLQRLIAASVLSRCRARWRAVPAASAAWIRAICSIGSTPRRSCPANASRYSRKACRAWNRACRRIFTRAPRSSRKSISRTRRPRRPPPRHPPKTRNRNAPPNPRASSQPQPAPIPPPTPRRGRHGRSAAGSQAQEDRPQAHHCAAARSAGRRATGAARHRPTIRRAIPGAAAGRYVLTLISVRIG